MNNNYSFSVGDRQRVEGELYKWANLVLKNPALGDKQVALNIQKLISMSRRERLCNFISDADVMIREWSKQESEAQIPKEKYFQIVDSIWGVWDDLLIEAGLMSPAIAGIQCDKTDEKK